MAEILGVVAEHYTGASAAEEIAPWWEAHGGSLDPLVAAIDDCPFVTRHDDLLQTLAGAVPEGPGSSPTCPVTPDTARSPCSPAGRRSARRTRPRKRPPG